MENDNKEKEIYEDPLGLNENIFRIEYKGQNIKKNEKFLNWKNMTLEKSGKEAQLFYCNKDNIFFYVYDSSCFRSACPICGNNICYFCSEIYENCCIKRKIYKIALDKEEFCEVVIIYFIPYINSIYIMLTISSFFLKEKIDENYHYFVMLYLFAIIISIPYIITIIIFLIILAIISIPFNFLPFRVFAGFLDENLRFPEMILCCFCCCIDFNDNG